MKVKNSDNEKTPQYAKYVQFDNGVVRFVGDFVATRLSFLLNTDFSLFQAENFSTN